MDKKAIIKYCKELGCCDACCIRYLGYRNPGAFENPHEFLKQLLGPEDELPAEPEPIERQAGDVPTTERSETDTENGENRKENCEMDCNEAKKDKNTDSCDKITPENTEIDEKKEKIADNVVTMEKNGADEHVAGENKSDDGGTPAKRARRSDVCVACMGILQEETWPRSVEMAQAELKAKGYDCKRFSCALSPPIVTALREKAVSLRLRARFPEHEPPLTSLKEAWKWSFCGGVLAPRLGLRLGPGAPLLLAFHMHYAHDERELSRLASSCNVRRISNRRELDACLSSLQGGALAVARGAEPVVCAAVRATHEPAYIGGRYIKLSRNLPQTPWILHGERMMPSSVQEVIFAPVAELYRIRGEEVDRRLKLVSAGREDVDVRCLGDGRPFAIEIVDPRFEATEEQLQELCRKISLSEHVKVKVLRTVSRSQLAELKKGEENKLKSYEALCIKLRHTDDDIASGATPSSRIQVTSGDVARINSLTPPALEVNQRTPLRVLHRRPLHTRTRRLTHVEAIPVPEHPSLVRVRLVAQAGTYVKEWVHGEAGRTSPSLRDTLPVDILALDVLAVQLDWPPAPAPAPAPAH